MTEITQTASTIPVDAIKRVSIEELYAAFRATFVDTVERIRYMALIWRELEERGEDLSELRTGINQFLGMVANGTLQAEALASYAGQSILLKSIASLSTQNQQRLLEQKMSLSLGWALMERGK